MTCLRAIGRLADGAPWISASELNSKGCGANMRVAPVGLLPDVSDGTRAAA
ncbi:MAG TPA: ADP-ribosylglycohydrolase family protein, partial [Actinocrinis sp.]|nr:ADP-ribosylglycohydrolase family protein [Actinocrinis sp.]